MQVSPYRFKSTCSSFSSSCCSDACISPALILSCHSSSIICGRTVRWIYWLITSTLINARLLLPYFLIALHALGFKSRNGGKLCFFFVGTMNRRFLRNDLYHLSTVFALFTVLKPIFLLINIASVQHLFQVHPFCHPFMFSKAKCSDIHNNWLLIRIWCFTWLVRVFCSISSPPSTTSK